MLIEIKGTGNHNKGAEMMLLTILQNISMPGVRFAYAPALSADQYPFYSALGLYPKLWFRLKGVQFGNLGALIPKPLRDAYGLVLDGETDAVLDASGFAYSDQWGDKPTAITAAEVKRWKGMGKKVILLPQAFGPFGGSRIRRHMQTILKNSDLVYARDMQSYRSLIELGGGENVRISPDFTALFEGERPEYFDAGLHQVCIVPNMRILDKRLDSSGYADLLGRAIACLQENGLSPYFLIYGGDEDRRLAEAINTRASRPIPVVNETDPRYLKGLIGEALGMVGSRYHAIASSLYSGVVPVGFGWSHKYEQLYNDMGFPEGLIDLDVDKAGLERALQPIIDTQTRRLLRDKLLEKSEVQKQMARQMFSEARECLSEK